ncbi:glycosyltransferase family 2 protein [Syntrophomonas erecta]
MKSVCAVIPAFNEEKRIQATLRAVKSIALISNIIVVNDGSTDATSRLAEEMGVKVLDLPVNHGKGGAMNAVLPLVNDDIIVFLDADLGESAAEAGKIIEPVVMGKADLSIAAFPPAQRKGGFGLVKGTAVWMLRRAGNMEAIAPLSGQRAMTREVLDSVTPFYEAYGVELGMTLRALQKGFRVVEVPTCMTHSETGRDLQGFIHRGRQFIDVVRVMLREARRRDA